MNIGLGFTALLGIVLFNIVQSTPFALNDMQQGILSLISIAGLALVAERLFPTPRVKPKPEVIVKTVVVEPEKAPDDPAITPEAHLRYDGNPDAGGGR